MANSNPMYSILNNPWYLGPAGIDRSNPENAAAIQATIDQYQAARQAAPVYSATGSATAPVRAPVALGQAPLAPTAATTRTDDTGTAAPAVAPAVAQFMPSRNDPNAGYGEFRDTSGMGSTRAHDYTRPAGTSFTGAGGVLPRADGPGTGMASWPSTGTLPRANDGGGYSQFRDLIASRGNRQ